MHEKYYTYINILNHTFNSDQQQITMLEWKTEYKICLGLINNIRMFFASSS